MSGINVILCNHATVYECRVRSCLHPHVAKSRSGSLEARTSQPYVIARTCMHIHSSQNQRDVPVWWLQSVDTHGNTATIQHYLQPWWLQIIDQKLANRAIIAVLISASIWVHLCHSLITQCITVAMRFWSVWRNVNVMEIWNYRWSKYK